MALAKPKLNKELEAKVLAVKEDSYLDEMKVPHEVNVLMIELNGRAVPQHGCPMFILDIDFSISQLNEVKEAYEVSSLNELIGQDIYVKYTKSDKTGRIYCNVVTLMFEE